MMGTQRLDKLPVTNEVLDLWRQYQEALCDGEDSPEAKRLDFEIWRRLDLVPGIDHLDEDALHLRAYPDPATRPARLSRWPTH
jgi:hypothetical protein